MNNYKAFWKRGDVKFVIAFTGVFLVSFIGLYSLGLVPNELTGDSSSVLDDLRFNAIKMTEKDAVPATTTTKEKVTGEEPVHLTIPNTDVDILVQNPQTKDNTVLDEYLTRGTIRYPDSALLGAGNVLIFGHSSNWAVVHNKAYKSLNGIEKLKAGDLIYVDSATNRYTYSVENVNLVDADKEFIDFGTDKNMLTLSTCNTFGQKQERYVAEAVFKSKTSL
ncbi:MAG: Peptidase sortase-like protein [Candidatus Taylorbacteria bacterium]|nr:Peptidase sortase-like protein [Candidatus Taylorbacteria bacterium]